MLIVTRAKLRDLATVIFKLHVNQFSSYIKYIFIKVFMTFCYLDIIIRIRYNHNINITINLINVTYIYNVLPYNIRSNVNNNNNNIFRGLYIFVM